MGVPTVAVEERPKEEPACGAEGLPELPDVLLTISFQS